MSLFAAFAPEVHGEIVPRVVVRRAVPADLSGILGIDAVRGPLKPGHPQRVLDQITDLATFTIVAQIDELVVGSSMARWWSGYENAPDGYYVSGVTVQPAWRRHRIGDGLLTELLTWIWQREDSAWSVINAQNLPSLALHERRGFREVARGRTLAGITFVGGAGVLLQAVRP
ncbi:GNAT family N-acetyltransferase [Pengzhenrongella sp.]|jgi:L-amino acid N-acyltransferase YncA|uniref:GNAT family N-acetyltransferase n=1 Tax=Pengzhenrongella sp. TaxID=2888820 RepID=UPI002F929A77